MFLILLISGCLLTGAGYAGRDTIYSSYSRKEGWMTPGLSLVFQGMKDGIYPWDLFASRPEETLSLLIEEGATAEGPTTEAPKEDLASGAERLPSAVLGETGTEEETEPEETETEGSVSANLPVILAPEGETGPKYDRFGNLLAEGNEAGAEGEGRPEVAAAMPETPEEKPEEGGLEEENPSEGPKEAQSEAGEEPSEPVPSESVPAKAVPEQPAFGIQEDGPYEFVPVGADYFNDALFIGDSRTVGLSEYGKFQPETTFYAATSMTIYQVFRSPKRIARLADGSKATIEEALTERKFGKIYLMLGINEMGNGTTESFFTAYAEAVNRIRMLQPQAIIFVQGIMRVGRGKSSSDAVFNNARIDERNRALAAMSNGKDIFYLEVNDVLCDENGDLTTEYTFDQIHLKAKYYQLWKDYLFAHGIVREQGE